MFLEAYVGDCLCYDILIFLEDYGGDCLCYDVSMFLEAYVASLLGTCLLTCAN